MHTNSGTRILMYGEKHAGALSFNMKVTECELIENTCNIYEQRSMLRKHLTAQQQHVAELIKQQNDFIIMDL